MAVLRVFQLGADFADPIALELLALLVAFFVLVEDFALHSLGAFKARMAVDLVFQLDCDLSVLLAPGLLALLLAPPRMRGLAWI